MNDVLYETVEYGSAGAEFFQRRARGDLGSFYASYQALIKVVDNPGGLPRGEVLKQMYEIVQGLGSPQGTETGQDKIMPFLEAYLDFIEEGGHIEGPFAAQRKWLSKQIIWSAINKTRGKATSLAQEYAGPGAESENELELLGTVQTALQMGIVRKGGVNKEGRYISDLYERLRKKHGVKTRNLLLAILRDWGVLFLIGLGMELGKAEKNAAKE
jgi:hypothetical protein